MDSNETPTSPWRAIVREPMVHFLGIAVLIFGLYGLVNLNREFVLEVDQGEIDAFLFAQELGRGEALSEAERELLTARYVEQQLLVREALALGLDNDARIHDMLAQKMLHVLSGDIIQPTSEELESFYAANLSSYTIPASLEVIELIFDAPEPVSGELQTRLKAGADADELLALVAGAGSSEPLPLLTPEDLASIFDAGFAAGVAAAEPGEWTGPYISNRGQHWIQIRTVVPERLPALEEIRDRVRLEWINAEEEIRLQEEVSRLFDKYTILVTEGSDAG